MSRKLRVPRFGWMIHLVKFERPWRYPIDYLIYKSIMKRYKRWQRREEIWMQREFEREV